MESIDTVWHCIGLWLSDSKSWTRVLHFTKCYIKGKAGHTFIFVFFEWREEESNSFLLDLHFGCEKDEKFTYSVSNYMLVLSCFKAISVDKESILRIPCPTNWKGPFKEFLPWFTWCFTAFTCNCETMNHENACQYLDNATFSGSMVK